MIGHLDAGLDALAQRFERFAVRECRGSSPLYERLALGMARDPALLELAAAAPAGQPVPNLFLAAVHLLLLEGRAHPLAACFPSLAGDAARDGDPYPDFREFCLAARDDVLRLISTRRVQTNEVQRCLALLPAFGLVARAAGGRPLALIELGAAAGLNLLWDRYGYDYGDGRRHGDRAAPVQLACAVRGDRHPPVPVPFPAVASRVGLDLAPVDVRDPEAARWLRALVWPEHGDRAVRLERAIEIAGASPPPLMAGDALDLLPDVLSGADRDAVACVVHTFTLNQWVPAARERLSRLLAEHARARPLARVSIEWDGEAAPRLRLAVYPGGIEVDRVLARCNGHARWLEWLVDDP